MSFTGADYHRVFEEACTDLARERHADAIRAKLLTIEWILWEALRGIFFLISMTLSGLVVFPTIYLMVPSDQRSWVTAVIGLVVFAILTALIYWICRGVFHWEFAVKVQGRRFGDGGL